MAMSGARLLGVLTSGGNNAQIWSLPCRFCSYVDDHVVVEVVEVGVQAGAFCQHAATQTDDVRYNQVDVCIQNENCNANAHSFTESVWM